MATAIIIRKIGGEILIRCVAERGSFNGRRIGVGDHGYDKNVGIHGINDQICACGGWFWNGLALAHCVLQLAGHSMFWHDGRQRPSRQGVNAQLWFQGPLHLVCAARKAVDISSWIGGHKIDHEQGCTSDSILWMCTHHGYWAFCVHSQISDTLMTL